MEAFFISLGLVALAEIGDKTQLLVLVLAARFRRPWPIFWGIVVAAILNHSIAGALGNWLTALLGPTALRWVLGAAFLGMAAWMLIPDKLDANAHASAPRLGVFGSTAVSYFLAEMGDKTQIATIALAAKYHTWAWVVAGTTVGMVLADAPAIWLGDWLNDRVPLVWVRRVCAAFFSLLALLAVAGEDWLKALGLG